MHDSVISVPTNVDQTQSILSHLPHDSATIDVLLKKHLEYKLRRMLENVCLNMVMVGECTLRWFIFCVMMSFLWNALFLNTCNKQ